jgi:hypothetical protein
MAKANFLNSVRTDTPNRNFHDLTHDVKTTLDMGNLVPVCVQECVPGDAFKISGKALVRFMPLVSPTMHRFDVSIHYFFVPNRLLWDKWEDFITGREDVSHPSLTYNATQYGQYRLLDYMGLNPRAGVGPAGTVQVNPLPFAAYQMIYNEWYRDQNLSSEVNYKLLDGAVDVSQYPDLLKLQKRAWEHDMFTAALPFAQAGTAVDLPLGTGTVSLDPEATLPGLVRNAGNHDTLGVGDLESGLGTTPGQLQWDSSGTKIPAVYDPNGTLQTTLEPTTINSLRRAFALQRWLERIGRVGRRYVEYLKGVWDVTSDDARLQRPEYITGTKSPVIISEVLNTTGEIADGGLPQGNMSGHGISVTTGNFGQKFCKEHGWIIGIMSVMPKTAYMQGIPRHFIKREVHDYLTPDFEHIGEQEVFNGEVYANATSFYGTFGYMPRYAEYRYNPSYVCGDFKNSLDFWHLARKFDTEPVLNSEFIECNPDKRIFAVTDPNQDSIVVQVLNTIGATRPLSKFGTPI